MDIATYLYEINYSAAGIIQMIWHEHADLARICQELKTLTRVVEHKYTQAEFVSLNAKDPDDVAMAAGMCWENYFDDDKRRHRKALDAAELQSRIDARAFSVGSLCASLLQIAKQGISVAHGGLASCPNGRDVRGHPLKEVIWQGRNQSIHWEEGKFSVQVQQLFNSLTANVDPKFGDYTTRNCAFDIVELLDWKTLGAFTTDMNCKSYDLI